ncbi:unnamed protein product [marine sediment metagenome]|uniref:DUF559 domain-containing protein n=1 Tax=marine sediment metagenome TaxID=412755 RepID=X0S3F7_9ZZZZ
MGEIDIENLFRIYDQANTIIKKHNLLYHFIIDHGSYETAIEFVGNSAFHPPLSKNWDTNPKIFCPDLLDYHNKVIIEYEEEIGSPRRGARLAKKGHAREGDIDNSHDQTRNQYYKMCGFRLLRIWDSDENWENRLEEFLLKLPSMNNKQ